jgi:dTDP-glucose 4,6-dehydratase
MTNLEVLHMLLRIVGKPLSLLTTVKDRPGHDRRYAVHFGKITRELGWRPETTFEAGLTQTIEWYQDNAHWVERCKNGDYRSYYETQYSPAGRG